jgi:hypothetical protein
LGTGTTPFGINDTKEISGFYVDAGNMVRGFIYSNGAFSRVDVVGATATDILRIKNNGSITGAFADALGEAHGLRGR